MYFRHKHVETYPRRTELSIIRLKLVPKKVAPRIIAVPKWQFPTIIRLITGQMSAISRAVAV